MLISRIITGADTDKAEDERKRYGVITGKRGGVIPASICNSFLKNFHNRPFRQSFFRHLAFILHRK